MYRNKVAVEEIKREAIDTDWWDQALAASPIRNPMIYSWSLDILAKQWSIFKSDTNAIAVAFDENFGQRRARQFPFSRQLDFLTADDQDVLIAAIKKSFSEIDVGISTNQDLKQNQRYQAIDLNADYHYATNAKRLLKKAAKFEIALNDSQEKLVCFYESGTRKKLGLPASYSDLLEEILGAFRGRNKAFVMNASEDGKVCASIAILLDKNVAYYVLADGLESAKKEGVIYALMQAAIEEAKKRNCVRFDFGGSNVESVAQFYRKFGASDYNYSRLTQNNLPTWFRFLKKFRRA